MSSAAMKKNENNNKVRGKHRRAISISKRTILPLLGGGGSLAGTCTCTNTGPGADSSSTTGTGTDTSSTLRPPRKVARTQVTTRSNKRASVDIDYSIRSMRLADLALVYHLGNAVFTASEFPNLYRTWDDFSVIENYTSSPELCFVAQNNRNQEIVAFLLGETMSKANVENRGYIQWVAVAAQYRRMGIATHLLQAFNDVAKKNNISRLFADTQKDNTPAIQMMKKAGLANQDDHVYMIRQIAKDSTTESHVSEDGLFDFTYTARKKRIHIRNMEIDDLHPVYLIGEQIFTEKSANLYNFWDEHLVLHSYMSDPDLCAVATVKQGNTDKVVGFCFGTTIEKPRSSWKYGYLVWLGCSSEYQGLGLASQLYNVMLEMFLLEKCRIVMIDTQLNNEGALKFFRSKGFGQEEEHVYLSN